MQCFVYASPRKTDTYVWLGHRGNFEVLPEPLRASLGPLRQVLEVDLTADRRLPREDATTILGRLDEQGWYLQLPAAVERSMTDT